jgi:4-alpha-glucanotransferase
VRRFAEAQGDRIRFHQWLQWLLDAQLARAAALVPVMQDLPIGFDASSADAWAWQDVVAEGVSVGAPPDEFNTQGQNWGLPPFIPSRLRRAGFRPFIETIRGTLRHAGGLRIDHVMGLFRLFWIPEGMGASGGAYVRNDADALLGIIALESQRAGAIVVGEDLGTVDERLRQQLQDANVLSYRLLWFEKDDPRRYPAKALAAITTHDLPTIVGLLNDSDLQAQRELGLKPNEEGTREMADRVRRLTRTTGRTPLAEVVRRTHATLARAPSTVLTATLDDAALADKRPNMPGTVDQWPNWSLPLPQTLERLQRSPLARDIARVLGRGRRRR